ncbi:Protein SYM1 [Porphyridium purpureum]|uniref:Protein SYM1 n=1 Tax=Porphyridium purpureum TaxID=35688 RepID=A0A5J4YW19_PORPP|nr:Protein SYM1 [Porphyridium purpureum]|eukprot:POR2587..scf227_4
MAWDFHAERRLPAFVRGDVLSPFQIQATLAFCLGALSDLIAQWSMGERGAVVLPVSGSTTGKNDVGMNHTLSSEKPAGPAHAHHQNRRVDARRVLGFATFQGLVFTPAIGAFYVKLDQVARDMELTPWVKVGMSVFCDQFLVAPFVVAAAFAWVGFVGLGQSSATVSQRIEKNLFPTIRTGWLLWIPLQLINFGLVPVDMRIIVVNVVALFWNAYLARRTATSDAKD